MLNTSKFRYILPIVATLFAVPALSLGDRDSYSGDGKFEDRGSKTVLNRYVLDLGKIDLQKSGTHEFKLSGLPEKKFVAGIVLNMPHPLPAKPKPDWFEKVNVKMVLIDLNTDKPVFEFDQPLSKYTRTNASPTPNTTFVYGRDIRSSFTPGKGDERKLLLETESESSFTPKKGDKLKLLVEIQSESSEAVSASLYLTASRQK